MMHTARRAGRTLEDALGDRCPTCNADPGAHCVALPPTENRPTMTPEPNRPDRTLDRD